MAAPPVEAESSASEAEGAHAPPLQPPVNLSIHALTREVSASADPAPPTRSTSTSPPWDAVALAVGVGDGEALAAGASLYTANDGKFADTDPGAGTIRATALESAAANGDEIEVWPTA